MTSKSLQVLEHLYLEDSYFLGMRAVGSELRLRVLFVLTVDHPRYMPPRIGDQHCYREGDIVISGLRIKEWKAGEHPTMLMGPDAEIDFGSIAVDADDGGYRVETEWFEMFFEAEEVTVVLDSRVR